MKTFLCQVCHHIAFDEAPVDCPVCGSAIENYEKDDEAIQSPADPGNLIETDNMHIPVIKINRGCAGDLDNTYTSIFIRVGEIEHVMESEHLIEFIDLYINKKYFSRVMFTAKKIHPEATLRISDTSGTLSVIAHCNTHGSWRTKIKLDE